MDTEGSKTEMDDSRNLKPIGNILTGPFWRGGAKTLKFSRGGDRFGISPRRKETNNGEEGGASPCPRVGEIRDLFPQPPGKRYLEFHEDMVA